VKRFRGELVVKTHRLLYHSTVGLRVIKKMKLPEGLTRAAVPGRDCEAEPYIR